MSRRAPRTDANQIAIVDALRRVGCSVQSLAEIGKGCPDLLVGVPAFGNILLEVKDGTKSPSDRKLTKLQESWIARWLGKDRVHIVTSVDDALAVVRNVERVRL